MKDEEVITITTRITTTQHEWLRRRSFEEHRPIAAIVREILDEKMLQSESCSVEEE